MKKLKIGLVLLFAATAFFSCGGEEGGILDDGIPGYKPPAGKDTTDFTITFKNGWENQEFGAADVKPLAPSSIPAVVNSDEKAAYDTALAAWKKIKAEWDEYEKNIAEYENSENKNGKSPPPPPMKTCPPNLFLL